MLSYEGTYIYAMEAGLLLAITKYRMGDSKQCGMRNYKDLNQGESYHFVRLISREGAAVNRMLMETGWKSNNPKYFRSSTHRDRENGTCLPWIPKASYRGVSV